MSSLNALQAKTDELQSRIEKALLAKIAATAGKINKSKSNSIISNNTNHFNNNSYSNSRVFNATSSKPSSNFHNAYSISSTTPNPYHYSNSNNVHANAKYFPIQKPIVKKPPIFSQHSSFSSMRMKQPQSQTITTKKGSRTWIRSSIDFKKQGPNKLIRRIIAGSI